MMKKSNATVLSGYDSFLQKAPAPEGTTGWYLPSLREWMHIMGEEGLRKASGMYKDHSNGNVTKTIRLANIENKIDAAFSVLFQEQYNLLNSDYAYRTSTRLNERTIYYMLFRWGEINIF